MSSGNTAEAARAALLPLDQSEATIRELLETGFSFSGEESQQTGDESALAKYINTAYKCGIHDPDADESGIRTIRDILVFAGYGAVRTQLLDPDLGPAVSGDTELLAEQRMRQYPVKKHPGLTKPNQWLQRYYCSTVWWAFRNSLSTELQEELAGVLLTPASTAQPGINRAYVSCNTIEPYRRHVTITDAGVEVAAPAVSQWCQLQPIAGTRYHSENVDSAGGYTGDGSLLLPWPVVKDKMVEYARHGWERIVHIAYNLLYPTKQHQLEQVARGVENRVSDLVRKHGRRWFRRFGTTGIDKREWQTLKLQSPAAINDKRLVTATDAVRQAESLGFDEEICVEQLYNTIRTYFPPPRRPSNAVAEKQSLIEALKNARTCEVTGVTDDHKSLTCTIPKPERTPLVPTHDGEYVWDTYLRVRTARTQRIPQEHVDESRRRTVRPSEYIKFREREVREATEQQYAQKRQAIQATAASSPELYPSISAVPQQLNAQTYPALTDDERLFLTRVGLAMERQIESYSLTDSMAQLKQIGDRQLQIDVDKLQQEGWLEVHPEGRKKLYTVPANRRKQLGIPNISNDGYGDLWRLKSTPIEPALVDAGLLDTRIDVIGLNDMGPVAVAEVETASNDAAKSKRAVDKLSAFASQDEIDADLVTPNGKHLWTVMRHLDCADYFDFDVFPDSGAETYRRSSWESKLQRAGVTEEYLTGLHTYRSLQRQVAEQDSASVGKKIIGNV
jgi:hypothetical protein